MQTPISQAVEETLEEALGHDPDYHTYRSTVQQRLEEALIHESMTKQKRRDINKQLGSRK